MKLAEPEGQILSFRHLAGSTEVLMRGTKRAPAARAKLKIGSRPGFVELDINRGGITGLKPAQELGQDFLTYVLWAVSVDGKASNLGEITFDNGNPVSVNLTTPYQTFWLMVTAEPNYAVVDPSEEVILYSVKQPPSIENKALAIKADLFFFTHYTTYELAPGDARGDIPNQLLQARKAVELASKSGVLASSTGKGGLQEEQYTREALAQGRHFLGLAEEAFKNAPKDQAVVQFARTAAQSAENARALAMGAVGGLLLRQLQGRVDQLVDELAKLKAQGIASQAGDETQESGPAVTPPAIPAATSPAPAPPVALVKQPTLWFAVAGWGIALVLLFRRRSI